MLMRQTITAKEVIRGMALAAGAVRCGFAKAEAVSEDAQAAYRCWVEAGMHGSMAFCERYADVRSHPGLLLPGARTVICCAFEYTQAEHSPYIADYALGLDYHFVLKQRLQPLADALQSSLGAECRIATDSAPLRERYWAQKAGVGFIGKNGLLIVPGVGSYVVLAEVLTTAEIEPDEPCQLSCLGCGACLKACPASAIVHGGSVDARRCISALTIETRGPLPPHTSLAGRLFGCDTCQRVCPHNREASHARALPEFAPLPSTLQITPEWLEQTSSNQFRKITARTPLSRAPLAQFIRNAYGG